MIDENTVWTTFDGRKVPLKDMEDTHLANVIAYLVKRDFLGDQEILAICRQIAQRRKLTDRFLDRAEIPYRINGEWYLDCRPI